VRSRPRGRGVVPARCACASETVSQTRAFSTRCPLRARRPRLLRQSSSLFALRSGASSRGEVALSRLSRASSRRSVQRAPSGHPPLANGPFFTAMSTNEVNMTSLDPPTPIEGARAVDASPPRRRVRRSRRMRLSGRRGRDGLGLANVILCT